mmetsp:Transcript_5118/g.14705  ORF Transcript_5118/g.14705 Transcript_5118/m.14705 type:complete len:248 (+) Transcript_5118:3663-4406(+)
MPLLWWPPWGRWRRMRDGRRWGACERRASSGPPPSSSPLWTSGSPLATSSPSPPRGSRRRRRRTTSEQPRARWGRRCLRLRQGCWPRKRRRHCGTTRPTSLTPSSPSDWRAPWLSGAGATCPLCRTPPAPLSSSRCWRLCSRSTCSCRGQCCRFGCRCCSSRARVTTLPPADRPSPRTLPPPCSTPQGTGCGWGCTWTRRRTRCSRTSTPSPSRWTSASTTAASWPRLSRPPPTGYLFRCCWPLRHG